MAGPGASPAASNLLYDLALAAVVMCVLAILILPIPLWLLDVLIIANLAMALITVVVSLYIIRPLDFASFPSLLLILTLLRLSINVATAKCILLHAEAGYVIHTFAEYVIRGNYLVGILIFLILILMQFIVVTEGSKRVAEVAARFTLDAMPAKQMAIDGELAQGMIDLHEAKRRRRDVEREANFFGSMDGANKFVKGDAIMGIVIMVVNIIGGFLVGVLMKDMEMADAAETYTLLTVGDGLVTMIPSLLISLSAGFVATRANSDFNLAMDLKTQLFTDAKTMGIASAILMLFGFFLPPHWPFFLIALAVAITAFLAYRAKLLGNQTTADGLPAEPGDAAYGGDEPDPDEDLKNPETVMKMIGVPPLTLELGLDLVPLVDPTLGGELMDRVVPMRVTIAMELGFIMPGIQFKDNLNLRPNTYQVLVKGNVVASGELLIGYMLAIQNNNTDTSEELVGFPTTEPAFGKPAVWVAGAEAQRATQLGYIVQDPTNVLIAHLDEVVRAHASEILSREEVQIMLNKVRDKAPTTVKELVPDKLELGEVQRVLQSLLKERVSIRDLATILEKLSDFSKTVKDPLLLSELVRATMARQICASLADENGNLYVITLDQRTEQSMKDAIVQGPAGQVMAINPQIRALIVERLSQAYQEAAMQGRTPAVLCDPVVRPHLKPLMERFLPTLTVLSHSEIHPKFRVQAVGNVSLSAIAAS
ncbi:MAG: flagellar biosynthesis protein FlhA [Candidatus Sericytochromatia bacterium]|nr:flagellar biosynthesis protein FlhA [Candidatus Sericytochromatia bacterium]